MEPLREPRARDSGGRESKGDQQMTPRIDSIAYPPRGLSREEAARYIGVGTTKFDELVSDGRMPKPKRIDGRRIWDRLALDLAFSDLPSEGNAIDEILSRSKVRS
jgi:predicted DNA-binding transcriptional regulator AlpA